MPVRRPIYFHITIALFFLVGVAWTWFGSLYDLRWPWARVAVSAWSALASIALMYLGLRLVAKADANLLVIATLSILPWNGVYLSQLAYIGFFFIPLEFLVTSYLLRRFTSLSILQSLLLAALVRGAAAGLTLLCIGLLRSAHLAAG